MSGTLLRLAFGLCVGGAVAGAVGWYTGVNVHKTLEYASGVPLYAILLCCSSAFVMLALQAWRWHSVMGPLLGLRYRDAYKAQIVGVMFNAILPARGGDLLRVQYLGRRTGKSRATILGTEIADRWLDWGGWIPTFLVLLVVSHPPKWLFIALGAFGALLAAMAAVMVTLLRTGWTPKESSRFHSVYLALRQGFAVFRQPRTWLIAFLIAPLPWLWESCAIAWAAEAFGIHITLVQAFSTMMGFNVAMAVPSPGGMGTIESGGQAALVWFGQDPSRAMAFIFVYHLTQLLPGIAGGAAVLVAEGEKLFGAASEVPQID
ncbi:MAG: flippase-like domain-containing protein, partial [Deltaproteobacteria bacterium]|nr:flippase-like domain-containing protein [Deltaproteobacteria bacterium]